MQYAIMGKKNSFGDGLMEMQNRQNIDIVWKFILFISYIAFD